jgi:hypothetical protein
MAVLGAKQFCGAQAGLVREFDIDEGFDVGDVAFVSHL